MAAADGPDFSREVRPLLARYCLKCHGPDDKGRKGDLQLDVRADALQPAKSGACAIVPGQPEASEMVKRLFSDDPDEIMPPPSTKQELSAAEKDTLKRWIAAGAEYRQHWAFEKPVKPPVPTLSTASTARNEIDAFVFARLEQEKLSHAREADAATLCRRVYLDLIGLPPSPDELRAFLTAAAADPAAAYEKLVDSLLASPHYGERWARKWMDLARYSDTNGYEKDRPRNMWPWRDWVIDALNADMPYDRFTIEQIAGDLLPNATRDQLVATGFHRNTMLNEEGGIDPQEFRYYAMVDRVNTTGTTWLGLTLGCCQCHTHKYDPLPQKEYYGVMAFLNNADEPDLDLPPADAEAAEKRRAAELKKQLAGLAAQWPVTNPPAGADPAAEREKIIAAAYEKWLAEARAHIAPWTTLKATEARSNSPLLTIQPDGSILASGDITKSDTYDLAFITDLKGITAIRIEALPDDRLPRHGPGLAYYEGPKGDFFLGEFALSTAGEPVKLAKATQSYAKNAMGGQPVNAALAIDGDPQTGWSCHEGQGRAHEAVFQCAEPLHPAEGKLALKLTFGRHYACSLGKFRISVTTSAGDWTATTVSSEVQPLLHRTDAGLTAENRAALREAFLLQAPELAKAREAIDRLRQPPAYPTALVFRERPPENPRATHIHRRGEFTQPEDPVSPTILSVLNPLPPGAPKNRLAFAQWLVSRDNPLTARVAVNRAWGAFFGQALVKTVEDFGYQGASPTHPELLDWLAVSFMENGWSFKKLHRQIVLSAVYRQSSRLTAESSQTVAATGSDAPAAHDPIAVDPENRLLWHGPRHRLEAEQIRDSALKVAGLLSGKIGGPSVYPPQPPGVTTEGTYGAMAWTVSQGEDRYRRGLYTFAKRTAPYAMGGTFDAPSGEACLARRDNSNTPLQALTLLNDVVFTEAAQKLGASLAASTEPVENRMRAAIERVFARAAEADEIQALVTFLTAQQNRIAQGGLDAGKIAGKAGPDAAAQAAWTLVARALLNTDEFVTKH